MTREEALDKAIGVLTYHQVNFCKSKEAVANMNEIIEALEKIDQEQCEDCIRRSDIGLTDFEIVMCNGDYKEGLKMLLDKIEKAPSVTPMLKMGKWNVTKEKDELYSNVCICSECGRSDVGVGDYCRWCGAKMQEVEE